MKTPRNQREYKVSILLDGLRAWRRFNVEFPAQVLYFFLERG